MTRIAAIDQGTTSTRVLVAGSDGPPAIAHSVRHATTYPAPGWVEQDALELLSNVRDCLAAAGPVDAIGLANQGESCLAWDAETGVPLSPVIVWQDSRTAGWLAEVPADTVQARSGLPLDPYFSASKLGWIVRTLPAVQAALAAGRLRLGTTDAFVLDRLTGVFATDRATASRTSLMDFSTGQWDDELCRLFGVPKQCLPEIRPNCADFGVVDGVPVVASIVDQQAALYGHGCRAAGDAKITFGTGAFALALADADVVGRDDLAGLLPTVAWDIGGVTTYALDGGIYDVGSAVEWAIRAGIAANIDDFREFAAPPAIERGLVFVPAFSGLACPHWDRTAAPLIIGLSPDTTRSDLCQALLEGLALLTADVVAAIGRIAPSRAGISIDGGVSRSPYFTQFLADCLGRDVTVRGFDELTAWGTACLAATTLGTRLIAGLAEDRTLRPRATGTQMWHDRFREAVGRARAWRTLDD